MSSLAQRDLHLQDQGREEHMEALFHHPPPKMPLTSLTLQLVTPHILVLVTNVPIQELMEAVISGDQHEVELLLSKGADPNGFPPMVRLPLHCNNCVT